MRSEKNTHHCLSSKSLFRETEVSVKTFSFHRPERAYQKGEFFYPDKRKKFRKGDSVYYIQCWKDVIKGEKTWSLLLLIMQRR